MNKTVLWGVAFGFVLVRAGATDFDAIHGMFKLADLHLMGVMGVAIGVTALGFLLFRKGLLSVAGGATPKLVAKPWTQGVILGGLLFGTGWAVSGTCPGTALAQIGQGKMAGLISFAGIVLGSFLHAVVSRRTTRVALPRRGLTHRAPEPAQAPA